ncbi:hypothetical protein ACWKSP_39365 [Micromonosporaceae bacterium Da 78-11]
MPRVRSKAPRRTAALFVASAAVLFTAACGGGSDSGSADGGAEGANGGGGNNAAMTAYVDCMGKNGVTITMPTGGARVRPSDGASRGPGGYPSGMPRPSGSAGARGGGGFPGGGGSDKPEGVDDATWQKAQTACASLRPSFGGGGRNGGGNGMNVAYLNCLKENGVTATGNLATEDPTVKKAIETCKVLQPTASATPSA